MKQQNYNVVIGIDWADKEHAVAILADGKRRLHTLDQTPEAIEEWALGIQEKFRGQTIAICLEQSRGALIYALMKYGFLTLIPINPSQLSSYRDTLKTSGAKDDPTDALLLAQFAQRHQDQLTPLQPDDEATRYLREISEDRRKLVDRRTAVTNTLKTRLKQCFPQVLTVFKDFRTELCCMFLRRYTSLEKFQKADFSEVEKMVLIYAGPNCAQLLKRMKDLHNNGKALIGDEALIRSGERFIKAMAAELKPLLLSIDEYDKELSNAMKNHQDQEIFESLPGAGAALAPRLLVAFGSVRDRFESALEIQQLSGIAPVLRRSGRSVQIQRRLACNKFLRQTFHEFAGTSIHWSHWAKTFYERQRDRGKRHHAALRALAYKWIRIIFRCWKNKTKFDEAFYLTQTQKKAHTAQA